MVRNNILKNRKICEETGLEHFTFEVVTDKLISLVTSKKVRELVVPEDYSTKSGALYKSRALQYCLEKEVSCVVKCTYKNTPTHSFSVCDENVGQQFE